jgi:hypothetical protein
MPEALLMAGRLLEAERYTQGARVATQVRAAAELRRLHSVNAELLEALRQSADLAEYWFLREDRRNLSESEHKTWHALGYGSSAYKAASAAIAKAEGVKP